MLVIMDPCTNSGKAAALDKRCPDGSLKTVESLVTGVASVLRTGIAATWKSNWEYHRFQPSLKRFIRRNIRPLKILLFIPAHRKLLATPTYRNSIDRHFNHDPFRYLSHKHYVRKGLSVKQRVELIYRHSLYEANAWNADYFRAVHFGMGLELWRADKVGSSFNINLQVPSRNGMLEGDLEIVLRVDNRMLHRITFVWLAAESGEKATIFVGRSQGVPRSQEAPGPKPEVAFRAFGFRPVFAQFFCFAALQGLARVARVDQIYGVRASDQIFVETRDDIDRFQRAYDDFWRALGASDDGECGFRIDLPVHAKLTHTPKESRKIWEQWAEIEAATVVALDNLRAGSVASFGK